MPSRHSSSSHSSSSRSSHSSSSRSSFSSSRSYSSSGSSRGPSGHSSSSHSSSPIGGLFSSSGRSAIRTNRPRVNQPSGYTPTGSGSAPRQYYGRLHDYIYYPVAWIDSATGKSYEKGYYDENGNRYDDVSFRKDDMYKNVLCHCPYCDTDSVMNLTAADAEAKKLQCPSCGAPVEVRSALDTLQEAAGPVGTSYTGTGTQAAPPKTRGRGCMIAIVVFMLFMLVSYVIGEFIPSLSSSGGQEIQGAALGSTLRLVRTGIESFRIADEGESATKTLGWDSSEGNYYDKEADCWLWYNTEVDPPLWQYWYEGISSDYGDYGWMEHESSGWFIEVSDGNWKELPAKYDQSRLWYIE